MDRKKPTMPSPIDHVNGWFSISGLALFYLRDCRETGVLDTIVRQQDFAVMGLIALAVLSIDYISSQLRRAWPTKS